MSDPTPQSTDKAPIMKVIPRDQLTDRQRQIADSPHLEALTTWIDQCSSNFPVEDLIGLTNQMFDIVAADTCNEVQQTVPVFPTELRAHMCNKIREIFNSINSRKLDPTEIVTMVTCPDTYLENSWTGEHGPTAREKYIDHLEFILMLLKLWGDMDTAERHMCIQQYMADRKEQEAVRLLQKAAQAQIQESKEESKEESVEIQDNPLPQ